MLRVWYRPIQSIDCIVWEIECSRRDRDWEIPYVGNNTICTWSLWFSDWNGPWKFAFLHPISMHRKYFWKSRIRETPNLLTNADKSTYIFLLKKRKQKSIWNKFLLLVLRLYDLVHKWISPPVEHLPCVNLPWV